MKKSLWVWYVTTERGALNKSGLIAKYAGVGREAIRRSELY